MILDDLQRPVRTEDRMEERWYSADEIALHLGVARETVYRWISRKGLPGHQIGKFWKFKISEVDRWVLEGQGKRRSRRPSRRGRQSRRDGE